MGGAYGSGARSAFAYADFFSSGTTVTSWVLVCVRVCATMVRLVQLLQSTWFPVFAVSCAIFMSLVVPCEAELRSELVS